MSFWRRLIDRARGTGPTADELAVLRVLLQGDDPRLRLVFDQLHAAQEVVRDVTQDGFRVRPGSITDAQAFPLEVVRIESDWIRLHDRQHGRELDFRIVIGRHGFLDGLEGRTTDGTDWPHVWSVDTASPDHPAGPYIELPSEPEIARVREASRTALGAWIGRSIPMSTELWPPASDAALAARELALHGHFAPAYRTFLSMTDGMTIAGSQVFGHRDCYTLENVAFPGLVVAWDSDDDDDYVVVTSLDGQDETIYRVDVHEERPHLQPIANDFAAYLVGLVG